VNRGTKTSWIWFCALQIMGSGFVVWGAGANLGLHVLGLGMLLPGSVAASYTLGPFFQKHYLSRFGMGPIALSDFLFLPATLLVNIVVFGSVKLWVVRKEKRPLPLQ
jgi:hypothetical protein